MPRISVPGFVGPTNRLDPTFYNAEGERTINLFCEKIPPGIWKTQYWMRNTPGLRPWAVLPTSPIRSLFQQDGRAWAVGGNTYYEVFAGGGYVSRGTMNTDQYLASQCSNGSAGHQNLVTSGGSGYVLDLNTNAFAVIGDADFPSNVRSCEFMDGYGIVFKANSRSFYISALEDFTDWDPLDVAERSIASDNIVAMIRRSRELWLMGSITSEVWYDSGDPLFPFQPVQNVLIEHGIIGPFAVQRQKDTLVWTDQNALGQGIVAIANGYSRDDISTYSIDTFIRVAGVAATGNLTTGVGWSYQENGHDFYVLMLPTAESSLACDLTMLDTGKAWHERCRGTCDTPFIPNVVNTHMFFDGKHLVGDRFSGAIYEQSQDLFSEQIVTP